MSTSPLLNNHLQPLQTQPLNTTTTIITTTDRVLHIPQDPSPHALHPAPRCHRHRLLTLTNHKPKTNSQRNDSFLLQHRNPPPKTNNNIQRTPTLRDTRRNTILRTIFSPFTRAHCINGALIRRRINNNDNDNETICDDNKLEEDFTFILECEYLPEKSVQVYDHMIVLGNVKRIIAPGPNALDEGKRHTREDFCLMYADTRFWGMGEETS
uniref:Ribosome maturation factor RimM n=1 Tax=Talaromyces marneffei PM1 TaxID=1077442 RepID=A0A093V760_TALMA